MRVLLVEPPYKRKYPPLGLMKLSTWYKKKCHEVRYIRGENWIDNYDDFTPDRIYITSLFTWDLPIVARTTRAFKNNFPEAEIKIGGVAASAIPKYVEKETGIKPHVGILKDIDTCTPDYHLSKETKELKESMVFTQRGCPHKCKYCVVRMIEPNYYELKGWEKAISDDKPKIVVFDNNILKASKSHINHVFNVLNNTEKPFDINSGFDVFLFKKEHAEIIAKSKIHPIRFAFDKMSQEKPLIKAVGLCKKAGINLETIRVYVLYNYTDDLKEARYRAEKVIKLGCKPFVMRYKPLDWLSKKLYVSPQWDREQLVDFTYYYNMPVVWNIMSYEDFLKERNEGSFEKERKKKQISFNPNKKIDWDNWQKPNINKSV